MNHTTARSLDQFYTAPFAVSFCLKFLKAELKRVRFPLAKAYYVEPSAGAGAFFKKLPSSSRLGMDLEPKSEEIFKADFLTWDPSYLVMEKAHIVSIGNPPFGKNSSLALKFLNKCGEFSEIVALILPKTFKKLSMRNKINESLHLIAEVDLPPNSFEFNGTPYDVPCVFQIWQKRAEPRPKVTLELKHPDFEFTTKQNAEFAIRRVGVLAGKVIENFQEFSPASHYYIRSLSIPHQELATFFKKIDWQDVKFLTAGNPSISKAELVAKYSEILSKSLG